jgi:hypothetical protein
VCAPGTFHLVAVDFRRAGPPFRRAQAAFANPKSITSSEGIFTPFGNLHGGGTDDHGPARALRNAGARASFLNGSNFQDAVFQRGSDSLMHRVGIGAFDEVGRVAIALKEALDFLTADAGEDGRIIDLVAVEMKYRQYGTIANGIQKFVGMPGRGKRSVSDSPSPTIVRLISDG